ncbi:MAG: succinyl-diaminopimelate desuccinylase [Gammaproteobacteria bacterium]|nr:MAG: succinyl-diaminopimelate desuccinylase [Gammaproteobacteria bacterium]
MDNQIIELTSELIRRRSVTPEDAGCQDLLGQHLQESGFEIEPFPFAEVSNFWAKRTGSDPDAPVFLFAGHTDVVPPGNLSQWRFPPFDPVLENDLLYGRGAADMKGSLAAMILATERFVQKYPAHKGSIAYLITSDEEGPFINGTVRVVDALIKRGEIVDYCLVGEPSSEKNIGDVIKNGRRGSLSGTLHVSGLQGHVAYPHTSVNAIHQSLPALDELAETIWDQGNDDFPASSFQITSFESGSAENVIPGEAKVKFNFRFSTEQTATDLQNQVVEVLDNHQLDYELAWKLNGEPFLTKAGLLIEATNESIQDVCGYTGQLSTAGGTSDGRFIAKMGVEIIELGPVNETIHKTNECVNVNHLRQLVDIYQGILEKLVL